MLAFLGAYTVSEAVDPINRSLRVRLGMLQERRETIEAIAVGNSHGGMLDFGEMGLDGLHFTSASQDVFEASFLARHALSAASRLEYVMFTASYGFVHKDNAVAGSLDLRGRRRRVYAMLPFERPIPGDLSLWIHGILAPVVRDDHWSGVLRGALFPAPPSTYESDGRGAERQGPPPGADSLARYGARIGAADTRLGQEMVSLAPGVPGRAGAALSSLAGDLAARDALLVLFTPPYHESYLRPQDPALNAEARAVIEQVRARNPNVLWFDYSADPRFAGNPELFNNSDHLNVRGGKSFSRLLSECLEDTWQGDPGGVVGGSCPLPRADP